MDGLAIFRASSALSVVAGAPAEMLAERFALGCIAKLRPLDLAKRVDQFLLLIFGERFSALPAQD
ncbi:MAG: hypothetical protein O3B01_23040 [Planctomycetota bacterium]|nr:hypothetical protein [Planctomycetota bacterium]MDA1141448.1 hypothetical protein [Planctomycetota bacterium]